MTPDAARAFLIHKDKDGRWNVCRHCGGLHGDYACPRIQSADYGSDGSPRRVQYWKWSDVDWSRVVFAEDVEEALAEEEQPKC